MKDTCPAPLVIDAPLYYSVMFMILRENNMDIVSYPMPENCDSQGTAAKERKIGLKDRTWPSQRT